MSETIDTGHDIQPFSPVCAFCQHFDVDPSRRSCTAFDEIPLSIWNGENDHTAPYPGDGGVCFTPMS